MLGANAVGLLFAALAVLAVAGVMILTWSAGWKRSAEFLNHSSNLLVAACTLILAIGTFLVAKATWDLVGGADAAAERQLRAYVYLEINASPYPPRPDPPNRFAVSLSITNGGQTWARGVTIRRAIVPRQQGIDAWTHAEWAETTPIILGPRQTINLQFHEIPFSDLLALEKGEKGFNYFVWVQYDDVISRPSIRRQTQLSQRLNADTEGPGHISFSYLPTHNCADDDCPK